MAERGFFDEKQTDAPTDRPSAMWKDRRPDRRTPRSQTQRSRRGIPCCYVRGFQSVSGGSEGVQGFRQCDPRQEMFEHFGGVQNPGFETEGDGRVSRPLI